jgi:hypothetical protein
MKCHLFVSHLLLAMGMAAAILLTAGCGTFRGKVVDQYAEPVPNAEVCVSYTTPSLAGCIFPFLTDWGSVVHHTWKKTGSDGAFRVVGFHGYNWRISGAPGAQKTGYEYQYPVEYDNPSSPCTSSISSAAPPAPPKPTSA